MALADRSRNPVLTPWHYRVPIFDFVLLFRFYPSMITFFGDNNTIMFRPGNDFQVMSV